MNFWQKLTTQLSKLSHYLAKPHILFYALPWLMILIILGTVTQKDLGLYVATEKYFNSFILWLGPIPTPGGLTTLGLIFLALSIKFIFFSTWKWHRAGTILTHLGVLILLIGGILTATLSYEGFMIIPEGKQTNKVADYRARVLTLNKGGEIIQALPMEELQKDKIITQDNLSLKILDACNNCSARAPTGIYENLQGLAVNMEIFGIAEEKNIETNFSGAVLEITTDKSSENGTYIVMEDIPKNPIFSDIEIKIERVSQEIPFSIYLQDFRKIDYPGTAKPRAFESDLIIKDGDIEWPATVSMNKPLRYKGYVFYQSSFEQRDDIEVSVLNVVKNKGRVFPYIATLIILLGLLLHFIIRIQFSKEKERGE